MIDTRENDVAHLARAYLESLADHPDRETLRDGLAGDSPARMMASGSKREGTLAIFDKFFDNPDAVSDDFVPALAALAVKVILDGGMCVQPWWASLWNTASRRRF